MNKHKILESMDQLFGNFEKIDLKHLEQFMHEILKLFTDVQAKLQSNDEKERAEAMELAEALQEKLNALAQKAYAASGLSKEKIQEIVSNPANFSPSDWETIKKLEDEMTDFQKNRAQNS